jgi:hypothetical protein
MAENIDDHNSTLCIFFCKSNADVAGLTNKADINTTPTVCTPIAEINMILNVKILCKIYVDKPIVFAKILSNK